MALADLDRFLLMRETEPALHERLARPMDLEGFLALAADYGFSLDESALLAEAFLNLFQSLMLTHEGQCPVRCVDWKLKHTLFSQKT